MPNRRGPKQIKTKSPTAIDYSKQQNLSYPPLGFPNSIAENTGTRDTGKNLSHKLSYPPLGFPNNIAEDPGIRGQTARVKPPSLFVRPPSHNRQGPRSRSTEWLLIGYRTEPNRTGLNQAQTLNVWSGGGGAAAATQRDKDMERYHKREGRRASGSTHKGRPS